MKIEITYSPYEEAINTGLQMGEEHQVIPECEWLRHIKRETGRKDLFIYHHQITDKFVLAHWIFPPWEVTRPVCLELETMDKHPDKGGWIPTRFIKYRCREVDQEEEHLKKRMKSEAEARDKERKRLEGVERKYAMVDHLKRKGMHDAALSLKNSKVHYSDGETETAEDLNSMAKGKIITHG
mgnify:CR=1 FL=1|jgi:hypothetical protein|tara:strand:+ start:4187 stop:4732 length:546 start_codon:yes stop_codon:yes gene_type:complete